MDFSPETLKARWDELTAQRSALDELLEPAWAELATIVQGTADLPLSEARTREAELRTQIRALQDDLFPIEKERGVIARALGGKTG